MAHAQDAEAETLEITASGEAYLRAVRRAGVETDVVYFDPDREAPALETDAEVPEEQTQSSRANPGSTSNQFLFWVIVILLLGGMAYLLHRFGGGLTLRDDSENAEIGRRKTLGPQILDGEVVIGMDAILALSDKREAIVALARRALADTLASNDILPQKSWTAREALRRVARLGRDVTPLRALVLTSERVQYGNRDISEQEFQTHVATIRPFLSGQTT
ncbi:DUF4129 domain-containing protein [Gymnodinialimonas sp. 2305UL16-5]|uniref:DUF4129 domain-containing protein n=1 Tax=Gymnodinialimonas mytili TaxID=3126503 RepID=UPI00309ABF83